MPSVVEPVPLRLDRERFLRLDNAGMLFAERELSRLWEKKISLFSVLASPDGLGLNDLSVLLFAALVQDDPSLTLLRVQDLMDMTRLGEMITAVLEAWNRATMPAQPQAEAPDSPLASTSTGPDSGVTPVPSLG
jgi:hypothetical protein